MKNLQPFEAKKHYSQPEVEMSFININDIIATSGKGDGYFNPSFFPPEE